MGMWSFAPWGNDDAADWYGYFMEKTALREAWLEGISEDPSELPEIVRAAAAIFVMLGHVYIWPIEKYDADLEMTIASLSQVAECYKDEGLSDLVEIINQDIEGLELRRTPIKTTIESLNDQVRPR